MKEVRIIEYYKKRKLSETLSDSMDFIQFNAKPIFKNLALVALPLAMVLAYFSKNQAGTLFATYLGMGNLGNFDNGAYFSGIIISSVIGSIAYAFIYGICASLMLRYGRGELSPKTGLSDLSGDLLSFSFKTLGLFYLIGVCFFLLIFLVVYSAMRVGVYVPLVFLLTFLVAFTLLIPLSLTCYPMYFKRASIGASLKEGLRIGFRKWGSTFVIILVTSLFIYLITVFLSVPYYLVAFLKGLLMGNPIKVEGLGSIMWYDIALYFSSFLMTFGTLLLIPFVFIPLAFQYCSAREEEEGISMESEIDHFDEI